MESNAPMIRFIDLPRHLCQHAVGKHHTLGHRLIAGSIIMVAGVSTAKAGVLVPMAPHLFHFSLDVVGYALHGLGCIPFIEYLMEEENNEHNASHS